MVGKRCGSSGTIAHPITRPEAQTEAFDRAILQWLPCRDAVVFRPIDLLTIYVNAPLASLMTLPPEHTDAIALRPFKHKPSTQLRH